MRAGRVVAREMFRAVQHAAAEATSPLPTPFTTSVRFGAEVVMEVVKAQLSDLAR
jgi:hypothetical protein